MSVCHKLTAKAANVGTLVAMHIAKYTKSIAKKQDAYLKAKNLYREAEALEMKRIIDKAAMHAMKKKAGIR